MAPWTLEDVPRIAIESLEELLHREVCIVQARSGFLNGLFRNEQKLNRCPGWHQIEDLAAST